MSKNKIAVSVRDLTKSFRIPLESSTGLKQKLINILKGRKGYRTFTPLNDISFDIEEGDFFGIVGRNGSGKSTLLKTIAGIYTPQAGSVRINGKLVPFIELGVGFNPELSGRENVYLNGALLGFSHTEMDAMYDDIVDFAELHDFMEERLKNYSSGMQVRLAFSIAIKAEGDILLLDEVLAVGDEAFQRKCYQYFSSLKKDKKTVVLVTHDMRAVENYCTKAILIEDGVIKLKGPPHDVAVAYSKSNKEPEHSEDKTTASMPREANDIGLEVILSSDKDGKESKKFYVGDTLHVGVKWSDERVKNVGVALIRTDGHYVYGTNTYSEHIDMKGKKSVDYQVELNVAESEYYVMIGAFGETDQDHIYIMEKGPTFKLLNGYDDTEWEGSVKLRNNWDV